MLRENVIGLSLRGEIPLMSFRGTAEQISSWLRQRRTVQSLFESSLPYLVVGEMIGRLVAECSLNEDKLDLQIFNVGKDCDTLPVMQCSLNITDLNAVQIQGTPVDAGKPLAALLIARIKENGIAFYDEAKAHQSLKPLINHWLNFRGAERNRYKFRMFPLNTYKTRFMPQP